MIQTLNILLRQGLLKMNGSSYFFLLTISKINSVNAQIYSQWHCLECVQTRSFFWSVFPRIRTEYGEILRIYTHSIRIRENTDQKKLRIWALFTKCEDCWPWTKALIWKREFYVKYCVSSFFFSYLIKIIATKIMGRIDDVEKYFSDWRIDGMQPVSHQFTFLIFQILFSFAK